MREWQKLAVAGIAVIGAAAVATPASAAPAGLQTLEFTSASVDRPEVLQIGDRRDGRRRHRGNNGINLSFGVFPFVGGYGHRYYGGGYPYHDGYPYRSNYYYADDGYDDSWLHCHGKRYWKHGKRRCTGRWHRHWN